MNLEEGAVHVNHERAANPRERKTPIPDTLLSSGSSARDGNGDSNVAPAHTTFSPFFVNDERTWNRTGPVDPHPFLPTLNRAVPSDDETQTQDPFMKLYVGNLAYSVNDSTLRSLFEPYGTVESARVISDRDSGQSKGFGFVEMSDADAQKAMGALNGREQDGRALRVNEAKPQEARSGGYGGGRGRY